MRPIKMKKRDADRLIKNLNRGGLILNYNECRRLRDAIDGMPDLHALKYKLERFLISH